ncbi:uncharacterized protein LOC135708193 [Ochlerotatus camptorhynchus]|uniref:uncharacterized protein LOC135708193 n=1 Tax=Ochlerotatus camptorhynchus TaxID=644619 RepID=UPI0031E01790
MINRGTLVAMMLLTVVVALNTVMADTAVARVEATNQEQARQTTTLVNGNRWWPYGWGWGWGWGIAAFVLAIVKGSILLGLFVIYAFFKGFGRKSGGCAPIIIRESAPPPVSFEHHHPWDRSSPPIGYARSKRSPDYLDSELYWTDLITDIAFSFLGVHSRDCRKRFVCEVDVRSQNDPMMKMATHALGVDIFRRYRSSDDRNANSFEECSQFYDKCKLAGPSITYNVFNGPIDLLQDYDDSMGGQFDEAEVNTQSASEYDDTMIATTTMEDPKNKMAYNKRKKFSRIA